MRSPHVVHSVAYCPLGRGPYSGGDCSIMLRWTLKPVSRGWLMDNLEQVFDVPPVGSKDYRECPVCSLPIPLSEKRNATKYHAVCKRPYDKHYRRLYTKFRNSHDHAPSNDDLANIRSHAAENAIYELEWYNPKFRSIMQAKAENDDGTIMTKVVKWNDHPPTDA